MSVDLQRTLEERQEELGELLSQSNPKNGEDFWSFKNSSIDSLLDSFCALYEDCRSMGTTAPPNVKDFIHHVLVDSMAQRIKELRLNKNDFEFVKRLGKGAFGEVHLVKSKTDKMTYAMKMLKKTEMLRQQETAFFMEERTVMSLAGSSEWLTNIHSSFQDDQFLYLVMEFVPGGDLMTLLCRRDDGCLDEESARFYIAETILAVNELHSFNFVHRDIKPDNLLLDSSAHVKLADFGSCIATNKDGLVTSSVPVGTPDYISPEILRAQEGKVQYGKESDWWSVGVVLYELLIGEPPFYADSLVETYGKIMDHKKHFKIPDDAGLSPEVKDLLRKLICSKETRLGKNGVEEIMSHTFFKGLDWHNLRKTVAPFTNNIKSVDDSLLDDEEEDEDVEVTKQGPQATSNRGQFVGTNLPFIGYSFQGLEKHIMGHKRGHHKSVSQHSADSKSVTLKMKIVNEKLVKLEFDYRALEQEYNETKKRLHHELAEKERLAKVSKTAVELEEIFESEKMELRKRFEAMNKEKRSVEMQLAAANEKLAKVTESEHRSSNYNVEKKAFQEEIAQLKSSISNFQNKANFDKNEKDSQVAALDTKLKEIDSMLNEKQMELAKISEDLSVAIQKLDQKERSINELKNKMQNLESTVQDQSSKIKLLNENLDYSNSEKEKLTSQTSLIYLELEQTKKTMEETKNELNFYQSKTKDLDQVLLSSDMAKEEAIAKISNDLTEAKRKAEELGEWKKKAIEETNTLHKEKMVLELSQKKLQEDLESEKFSKLNLQQTYDDLANKLSNETQKCSSLDSELELMKQKCQELQKHLSTAEAQLESLNSMKNVLKEVDKERSIYKTELDIRIQEIISLKQYVDKLVMAAAEKDSQIASIKASQSQELEVISRENQTLKDKYQEVISEKETISNQLNDLQTRMKLRKLEEDSIKQSLDKEFKMREALEVEIADWKSKLENEIKQRRTIQHEYDVALTHIEELKNRNETLVSDLNSESKVVESLTNENNNVKKRSELDQLKIAELVRKMEGTLIQQNQKSGGFFKSSLDTDKKAVKQKQREIKSLEQKLEQENMKRKVLEHEMNELKAAKSTVEKELEEVSKQLASPRRLSATASLVRRLSKKKSNIDEQHFETVSTMMEGYLKMPKAKGIRGGWQKVYAVVRDFTFIIQQDKDDGGGRKLFDLTSDVFSIRPANDKELIHVSARELTCIFVIRTSNVGINTSLSAASNESVHVDSTSSANIQELSKRKRSIQKDIEVEEKLLKGAMGILRLASGNQKTETEKQIEGSQKKLSQLNLDLEKLKILETNVLEKDEQDQSVHGSITSLAESVVEGEKLTNIANLERDIARDETVKEGLLKMISVTDPKKQSELQKELQAVTKNIQNLKYDLDLLKNEKKKRVILKVNEPAKQSYEFNGHNFKIKTFNIPMSCQQCHEMLWGFSGQGLECAQCKFVCHKTCYTLINTTCADTNILKASKPLYFMASDDQDKQKWIHCLERLRKMALTSGLVSESAANTRNSNQNLQMSDKKSVTIE